MEKNPDKKDLSPETATFQRFLYPESYPFLESEITRMVQFLEIAISGAINCQKGQQILYDFGYFLMSDLKCLKVREGR